MLISTDWQRCKLTQKTSKQRISFDVAAMLQGDVVTFQMTPNHVTKQRKCDVVTTSLCLLGLITLTEIFITLTKTLFTTTKTLIILTKTHITLTKPPINLTETLYQNTLSKLKRFALNN